MGIAYLGNWQSCPSDEQMAQYTHVVIAFAVSYQWSAGKNICSDTCEIASPPICKNAARPDLIQKWKAAGKKIILSFGGAGMGGSWAGDNNDCWDFCFGREEQVVNQLTSIVNTMGLDGVDIDYEYFHEDNQNGSGFTKGTEAQKFLKEVASSLDFLMPQYYNGYVRSLSNFPGALAHYTTVSNELFNGDASKIVYGFCFNDCGPFNLDGYQSSQVMEQLSETYPCNGGAFFWVANDDKNGEWSKPMQAQLALDRSQSNCSVNQPTPSPINPPVCENSKDIVYVNKKGKRKKCNWVKAGKTLKIRTKRCSSKKYSYLGKRIKENCPKACGEFAGKGICKNLFVSPFGKNKNK